MAKMYGVIGYVETIETSPGVHTPTAVEHSYFGELIGTNRQLESADQLNDNINIANVISIVADPFAIKNYHLIRYVEFMGVNWRVKKVEVRYPRLILTLGGVYNGEQA